MNLKYVAIGLARKVTPVGVLFAVMRWRGDGSLGETAPDAYWTDWWSRFQLQAGSVEAQHVLDVGSGRYARFGLRLLAAGARRVTLVDPYAVPVDELAHRAMLKNDCRELGLNYEDARCRIKVLREDFLACPVPEAGVDLAISSAVLEHVRNPQAIVERCRQWLKPGGQTFHTIDLRDHNLQFSQPFEMLTYSDAHWRRWFDLRGGFHLNRWRLPEYLSAMRAAGFNNVNFKVLQRDVAGLRAIRSRLNGRFQGLSDEMLSVLLVDVFGQR